MTHPETESEPALFHHCEDTYHEMLYQAKPEVLDGSDEEVMVYEGFLTELITNKLNLSVPYYTSITQALKKMGCARQLRRGGSNTQSQWLLIKEPTPEAFHKAGVKGPTRTKYATQKDVQMLEQQIVGLVSRVGVLESTTDALLSVASEAESA